MKLQVKLLSLAVLALPFSGQASDASHQLWEGRAAWQFASPSQQGILLAIEDKRQLKKGGFFEKNTSGSGGGGGAGGAGGGQIIGNMVTNNYEINVTGDGNEVQGDAVNIGATQGNTDTNMKNQANTNQDGGILNVE